MTAVVRRIQTLTLAITCMCAPIMCEEVLWALTKVKKDAALGPDGIEVRMMLAEPRYGCLFFRYVGNI